MRLFNEVNKMKNGKIPVSFSIVRKILYLIESASFSIFHGNALEEGKEHELFGQRFEIT